MNNEAYIKEALGKYETILREQLARAEKMVGKSLEAKVTLYTGDADLKAFLEGFGKELNTVFIVSGVKLESCDAPANAHTEGESGVAVLVEPADGCKCVRCWKFAEDGHDDGSGFLCRRCMTVLGL